MKKRLLEKSFQPWLRGDKRFKKYPDGAEEEEEI